MFWCDFKQRWCSIWSCEREECEWDEDLFKGDGIMSKLIESDDLGNWSLKGVPWKSLYVGQVITKDIHDLPCWGSIC